MCQEVSCQDSSHAQERDNMMLDILCTIVETSYTTLPLYGGRGGRHRPEVPGWTDEVKPYQVESRYWHDIWVQEGRPRGNWLHSLMVRKRSQYHYAIRRARGRADLTRAEHLFEASLQGDCKLLGSWEHHFLPASLLLLAPPKGFQRPCRHWILQGHSWL